MATVVGIPIAALPAAATLTGDELVPIAQGVSGAVKKSTTGAFVTLASGVIVPAAVAAATAAANTYTDIQVAAAILTAQAYTNSKFPVSNANLSNMAQTTVKGRAAGAGTGAPQDLTQTQLTALINLATSILAGAVPASGGGTTNFLRADMSWAPAGGSASFPLLAPDGDQNNPQYAFASNPDLGIFSDGTNLILVADGVIKGYINSETIQFNVDSDVETLPPLTIGPDDTGTPIVDMAGGRLSLSSRSIGGGDVVAGLTVNPGSVPNVLNEGDIWTTAAGDMFIFIDGGTKQFTLT